MTEDRKNLDCSDCAYFNTLASYAECRACTAEQEDTGKWLPRFEPKKKAAEPVPIHMIVPTGYTPRRIEGTPRPEPKPATPKPAAPKPMLLPTDSAARKEIPIARGLLDYFPLAVAEVARLSYRATAQHHPGSPMHWDRNKSADHADCIGRHLIDRGSLDSDGERHTAKLAWRALALLQLELEAERAQQ